MENPPSSFFLGFDLSSQSLKAVVLDQDLQIVFLDSVNFSKELPSYKTENGVLYFPNGEISSPTLMFVEAMDLLMEKLQKNNSNLQLNTILALSGSGQQHGSVYWASGAQELMKNLTPTERMTEQMRERSVFSNDFSPIWMDSTTSKYCRELEEKFGSENLCRITGSKAFERFTGNQIKKIFVEKKEMYENTEHISLISAFIAELFLGSFASPDFSDASGMNLFDINKKRWDQSLLFLCGGPTLSSKLSPPVSSFTKLGPISNYFVQRYGFNEKCSIIASSGDNPCSLIGSGILTRGVVGISLGTSDTVFSLIGRNEAQCNFEGHLFVSPSNEEDFMMLVCMKNGALVRDKYKRLFAGDDWEEMEKMLKAGEVGNKGIIGFFFDLPEIFPEINVENFVSFQGKNGETLNIDTLKSHEVIRALLESKAFLLRLSLEKFGLQKVEKVVITGGSSKMGGFIQIISDVLGTQIYKQENPETAALGAAFRAFHGHQCEKAGKFIEMEKIIPVNHQLISSPNLEARKIYQDCYERFVLGIDGLVKKYPYSKK